MGPELKTLNCNDLDIVKHIHAISAEALAQSCTPTLASAYARVGLMGNPSDGFFGKTISLLIKNFHATVTITPNASPADQTITIQQTPLLDPFQFASLAQLSVSCEKNGYYGVQRLMLAAAKVFGSYCMELGVHSIDGGVLRGFRVEYETNIPRQVGLAGSSALITAFLRALILYYGLNKHPAFQPHICANLALEAEKDELDIAAGLQDRVIQAYGGLVFMDFSRDLMESRGYGAYERLPLSLVPEGLWIAYVGVPSDSGKIHTNIRARFYQGDQEVITAMDLFADLATRAKTALLKKDHVTFAELMDTNFATRRSLYGDAVVGADNLAVVKIAHEFGHAAKFSGSGGCVVGLKKTLGQDGLEKRREMKKRIRALGYVFEELVIGEEEV
ncbi:ribosomal protein S5 domain 2-type protein [Obelidium mucronatum]|nr:ribosomal protein S5 domain 2-type protein [Obelidium mucronatum]